MFAGPFKLAFLTGVAAFVVADLLSYRTGAVAPQAAPTRASAESSLAPESAVAHGASYGRIELAPDRFGQFHAEVEIDGRRLAMLVDTGASLVALTYADAASVGQRPMPSDFKVKVVTANGTADAAEVRLREVRLDTILVDDVPAIVMPQGVAATSLLGMSFLKKLGGFEIADGRLVLKP
jgi:aspartyl protease family protein